MLAGFATAIGNSRVVRLRRDWHEPSIIWTGIVGDSGTRKTPAIKAALEPILEIQNELMRLHAEATQEYETSLLDDEEARHQWKQHKGGGETPERPHEPVAERLVASDATIEAVGEILGNNPRGIGLFRDELSGWIASFNQYKPGKQGADVAKWLEFWTGGTVIIDRKTGKPKTMVIPRASVSIAGGIQPEVLRDSLTSEYIQNGLAARFLLVIPPKTPKCWADDEMDEQLMVAVAGLYRRLHALEPDRNGKGEPIPRTVELDERALSAFKAFVNEHGEEQAELTGPLAAAWAKLEAYAARLALVIHLARWAAGEVDQGDLIDETSMRNGIELVTWFKNETQRVYGMFSETEAQRENRELAEYIQGRGGLVTARELMRRGKRKYRGSCEIAERALRQLVSAGYAEKVIDNHGRKGGRPVEIYRLIDGGDGDTTEKTLRNLGVVSPEGSENQDEEQCQWEG